MRNARCVPVLCVTLALASCVTVAKEPDLALELTGDYQAIADCSYSAMFGKIAMLWQKIDLPSMKTTTLTFGNEANTVAKIEFVGSAPGKTTVKPYLGSTLWGDSDWKNVFKPIIDRCAG